MKYKLEKIYLMIISFLFYLETYADIIKPDSYWLPWFWANKTILWWLVTATTANPHWFLTKWIAETIMYVWLLAIISLIIGWLMYITSLWDDAKAKKAKNIIIYSIAWIIVAMSAFAVIEVVNNLNIW